MAVTCRSAIPAPALAAEASYPSPKATLRREPGAFDLNDACKSAAKIRGSQSDGDYHRY
jgi:hypothetical protein